MTAPIDNTPEPAALKRKLKIKVVGVGGAGGNAINHMAAGVPNEMEFIAVNTDAQALANSAAGEKLVLGSKVTHGLGAGGDPEVGRAAAMEDVARTKEACAGADIVFVVAGLGGGTGTGASPVIAQAARETGALVLALVTLPFQFEGSRRQRQAQLGLQQLKSAADSVICLPNEKVFKLITENTSALDTFKLTNDLLAQAVRGIWRVLTQPGLINVDFADLCAITRDRNSESAFASAESCGGNRAQQVMELLFGHPLLEGGQVLSESDSLLVSISGGPDLTMSEINGVMEQINRSCENAHIIFGASIDERHPEKLSVTLIASRHSTPAARASLSSAMEERGAVGEEQPDAETTRPPSRFAAPPVLAEENKEQILQQQNPRRRKNASMMRQGQLPLEIVSKGRFEKSEPTIHHGEDLDVPTYIRRGTRLN